VASSTSTWVFFQRRTGGKVGLPAFKGLVTDAADELDKIEIRNDSPTAVHVLG
jgi:hypothetical protein